MKRNIFIPKYMESFKCIASECKDSCCSGWDINIDEDTYNNYSNSGGKLKELVDNKYILNKREHDYFNHGFMILKEENRCPFLNEENLCEIHKNCSANDTSITCRMYPRVYNIIDDVYEKSGITSCEEICRVALLNKEKMEFVELEEEVDEDIFIKRIIDTENYDEDNLFQYFWDIRVITINILQMRTLKIEERLNIVKNLYKEIDDLYREYNFEGIDILLEEFNYDLVIEKYLKNINLIEDSKFYKWLCNDELLKEIKSINLKNCIEKYKNGIKDKEDIYEYLDKNTNYIKAFESYNYIVENYLVNKVFKELIPFDNSDNLESSIVKLADLYRVIKAYVLGVAINNNRELSEEDILVVIQGFSKEIEHSSKFKDIILK